jgi:hypothetical protein
MSFARQRIPEQHPIHEDQIHTKVQATWQEQQQQQLPQKDLPHESVG